MLGQQPHLQVVGVLGSGSLEAAQISFAHALGGAVADDPKRLLMSSAFIVFIRINAGQIQSEQNS